MADLSSSPPTCGSPPPKCAICLGTCTNKCYSNNCMHQFCFTCLLEWSKVKAECPLCKVTFKSIIHNIKSNSEYDEYVIARHEVPAVQEISIVDNNDFLYLPPAPSQQFQFRTTFTVDPGGEMAIQQMLLSHPLTNNVFNVPGNYILPRHRYGGRSRSTRRASSASSFRRGIYIQNLWVYSPPDITGRYRDIRPTFYRDNPAARNRLVPWLNRELNALLHENTQDVMHLVDIIMEHLTRHHIRSRAFKNLLNEFLHHRTEHFIHEFYNFMRSPYDMIGYDRNIIYADRPQTMSYSSSGDDSDVAIVSTSVPSGLDTHPFHRPTLEVIKLSDSSDDSTVMVQPAPCEIINLIESDTDDDQVEEVAPAVVNENQESTDSRKPVLPVKIRFKRRRQYREHKSRNSKKRHRRHKSPSSRSSDDSSASSGSSMSSTERRKKWKKKIRVKYREYKEHVSRKGKSKVKYMCPNDSSSSDDEPLALRKKKVRHSDLDDNLPLSKVKKLLKKRPHTVTSKNYASTGNVYDIWQTTDEDDLQMKQALPAWQSCTLGGHQRDSYTPSLLPSTSRAVVEETPYSTEARDVRLPDFDNLPRYEGVGMFNKPMLRYSPTSPVFPMPRASPTYTPPPLPGLLPMSYDMTNGASASFNRSMYNCVDNCTECAVNHKESFRFNDSSTEDRKPYLGYQQSITPKMEVVSHPAGSQAMNDDHGYDQASMMYSNPAPGSSRWKCKVIIKKENCACGSNSGKGYNCNAADSSDEN